MEDGRVLSVKEYPENPFTQDPIYSAAAKAGFQC
jgi:hypothetical protein